MTSYTRLIQANGAISCAAVWSFTGKDEAVCMLCGGFEI